MIAVFYFDNRRNMHTMFTTTPYTYPYTYR